MVAYGCVHKHKPHSSSLHRPHKDQRKSPPQSRPLNTVNLKASGKLSTHRTKDLFSPGLSAFATLFRNMFKHQDGTTVQKWKQWPVYFTLCNFFIYIFLQGLTEFSICTLAGMQHSNIVKVLFVRIIIIRIIIINIQDLNIDQSNGDNHVGHNGAALLLSA